MGLLSNNICEHILGNIPVIWVYQPLMFNYYLLYFICNLVCTCIYEAMKFGLIWLVVFF